MAVPSLRRDEPLDIVRHLVTVIGSRQATSLGEAQAAAYVDSRMRRAGMSVSADAFRAASNLGVTYQLLACMGIIAALTAIWLPIAALLLALYGLVLAINDALEVPLPTLARHRDSQNIVATRACEGSDDHAPAQPRWRIVLLAPLDSPPATRGMFAFAGRQLPAVVGRVVAFSSIIFLILLATVSADTFWYILQSVPVLYFLLTMVPLRIHTGQTSLLGGASALATLLAVVDRLSTLRSVEIWAVALGATTTGNKGLHDFLARYPFPREDTIFVVLQNLDGDRLLHAPYEGIVQQYQADPELVNLVAQLAAKNPHINTTPHAYRNASSIASVLHGRHYRALTFFSRPVSRHVPAGSDVLTSLNYELLEQSIQMLLGLVRHFEYKD